jgi:hypothetical protein
MGGCTSKKQSNNNFLRDLPSRISYLSELSCTALRAPGGWADPSTPSETEIGSAIDLESLVAGE